MAGATFQDDITTYKGWNIRVTRKQISPGRFYVEAHVGKPGASEHRVELPIEEVDSPDLALTFGRQIAQQHIDRMQP